MQILRQMTLGDKILFILLLIFSLSLAYPKKGEDNALVEINALNNTYYYKKIKDSIIKVNGKLGKTTIEIKDGRVRVIDSPCNNKLCQHTGWIKDYGDMIICLPNHIAISFKGEGQKEYDTISY